MGVRTDHALNQIGSWSAAVVSEERERRSCRGVVRLLARVHGRRVLEQALALS